MAKASAPPGVPTPICRIEVVRATISPSLSVSSRRETHFRVLLITRDAVFWDVSGDFLRFRQRADPLVVVVELFRGRVLFLHQEHQLCIEQEVGLKSKIVRVVMWSNDVVAWK